MSAYLCLNDSGTGFLTTDVISDCYDMTSSLVQNSLSGSEPFIAFNAKNLNALNNAGLLPSQASFEIIGINSTDIFQTFMFGFGTVVLFWFFGYVISSALKMISKI